MMKPDATSHPSLPVAFRSKLYIERAGDDRWAAHLKVDYDSVKHADSENVPNRLSMRQIARFVKHDLARLSRGAISRDDVIDARVYRTHKGHHLRVFFRPDLPRLPAEAILAMQAALGDDERRQEMNAARVARNQPGYNVLWCLKYINGVLIGEEKIDNDRTAAVRRIFHVVRLKPAESRFWKKVAKRGPDDCWFWTGAENGRGYGKFYTGKNQRTGKKAFSLAHRFAFETTNGKAADLVLHSCDTPLCCNPKHLRDGTQSDNIQDAIRRGRFNPPRAERSGKTKLRWSDVHDIRKRAKSGESIPAIAKRYGLSDSGVKHIVIGRRWKEKVSSALWSRP